MSKPLLAILTCVGVAGGCSAAVAPTDPAQRVSIGIGVGTLTAVVYLYRDEFTKRLDRIERRLDAIADVLMRLVKT